MGADVAEHQGAAVRRSARYELRRNRTGTPGTVVDRDPLAQQPAELLCDGTRNDVVAAPADVGTPSVIVLTAAEVTAGRCGRDST